MKALNKIELRGIVGRIKREQVGDDTVARISLAVDYASRTCGGTVVVSCDWFNVVAWKGPKVNLDSVTLGSIIYVLGRVRMRKYAGEDGREHSLAEVVAQELKWEGRQ